MAAAAKDAGTRRLLRKYNVSFHVDKPEGPLDDDPEAYFKDIKRLGGYSIDRYEFNPTVDSRQMPWREKTVERAKSISAKARRCAEEEKNESGWRLNLETEILARFSIESRPECRRRLWKSEVEVAVTTADGRLKKLVDRQRARKFCNCPPRKRGKDIADDGLIDIFDDRTDETIQYEDEIKQVLDRGKRPDRVFGLRLTKRLERILDFTEGPDGKLVRELITTTPFQDSSRPLLFPFLYLEAKSEKSRDSFSKIDLQSGFALRNLLQLQHNLMHAAIENGEAHMVPLVWYLAYRGQHWHLAAAYVEEGTKDGEPNYHILQLWDGEITFADRALQLLLMLDYIFDWARDVYRKDIISALLSFVPNASSSLLESTDIGSTYNDPPFSFDGDVQEPVMDYDIDPPESFGIPHMLEFFDDGKLAIRDASYVTHRVLALHVTLENLGQFLGKMNSKYKASTLARQLWMSMQGDATWLVTADCLNAIERVWTGHDRESDTFQNPQQVFLASFSVTSKLAGKYGKLTDSKPWNQIHALSYIAIAKSALQELQKRTEYGPRRLMISLTGMPDVSTERATEIFSKLRFAPVRQLFAAAIARSELLSTCKESYRAGTGPGDSLMGFRSYVRTPCFTSALKSPETVGPAELCESIYTLLNSGMSELTESFLRISHQSSKHDIGLEDRDDSSIPKCWRKLPVDKLQTSVAVLVDSGGCRSCYCLFVFGLDTFHSRSEDGDEKNAQDTSERVETHRIYPGIVRTFYRGSRRRYKFYDRSCSADTEDFPQISEILRHVSNQYERILSTDTTSRFDSGHADWFRRRCRFLEGPGTGWPFDFFETVDNIKQIGGTSRFGFILDRLLSLYDTAMSLNPPGEPEEGEAED
ncbi:hypothetical protein PV08_07157 [Exophiala spinifera]|uniref:Uncharacterized protein n=1 Tax=Exophiala spinifera TaxID=91928 RepID=A0A0D2B6R7_9EURO|nr:uncharacterized protein PV08_07157 [Exophiala spinifera]KIW14375.1 hypothetical protein PV08_07157 [Exophiala spinifera]